MAAPQQILEDSTQTLEFYPPTQYSLGKVTAATVKIGTPSTSFPTSGDAATVSTVDTTLSSAASRGARSVAVGSATGITAGRRYLIGTTDGMMDPLEVVVRRVDGTTIHLRQPLIEDVASGDVFAGHRCSHALTAAETDERGRGSAEWTLTIDGASRVFRQEFYIVRAELSHGLTASDLRVRYRITKRLKDADDQHLALAIEAGWEALIAMLDSRGILFWKIVSAERLREPLAALVVWEMVRGAPRLEFEEREQWERNWVETFERFLQTRDSWYDDSEDLDVPTDDTLGPASFTRYTR